MMQSEGVFGFILPFPHCFLFHLASASLTSPEMYRIPPLPRDQLSADQQKLHDEYSEIADKAFRSLFIWKRKDGALVGPAPLYLAAPEVGSVYLNLIMVLARTSGLPADVRETAILAIGTHFDAAYVVYSHLLWATTVFGIPSEVAKVICEGRKPHELSEPCSAAYDVAMYLVKTPGHLPKDLWDKCEKALGKDGTVALVNYIGLYSYTSIILNASAIPVPKEGE